MFSLLRLCFVFNGEIYATEWAVFVSVDITFYSFALSYLLDFSFLHHSCRRIFTVFYVTTMNMIVLAAFLLETLFGRQIVLSIRKK